MTLGEDLHARRLTAVVSGNQPSAMQSLVSGGERAAVEEGWIRLTIYVYIITIPAIERAKFA